MKSGALSCTLCDVVVFCFHHLTPRFTYDIISVTFRAGCPADLFLWLVMLPRFIRTFSRLVDEVSSGALFSYSQRINFLKIVFLWLAKDLINIAHTGHRFYYEIMN